METSSELFDCLRETDKGWKKDTTTTHDLPTIRKTLIESENFSINCHLCDVPYGVFFSVTLLAMVDQSLLQANELKEIAEISCENLYGVFPAGDFGIVDSTEEDILFEFRYSWHASDNLRSAAGVSDIAHECRHILKAMSGLVCAISEPLVQYMTAKIRLEEFEDSVKERIGLFADDVDHGNA